jgi:hypothetical protein
MATWRRKAIESFPELRRELNSSDSIYHLYFNLLPMVREAHDASDDESLRKIYGFAEWCLNQKSEELWNSAGVCFYEHLFDDRKYWNKVVPWLSPYVIDNCKSLWEARLGGEVLTEIEKLIRKQNDSRYNENAYHTSLIQNV